MTTKTIHEAVVSILREKKRACTLDEIQQAIVSGGLYDFKVDNPRGVIRQAIRRRCEGYSNLDRTGKPLFREVGQHQYELVA